MSKFVVSSIIPNYNLSYANAAGIMLMLFDTGDMVSGTVSDFQLMYALDTYNAVFDTYPTVIKRSTVESDKNVATITGVFDYVDTASVNFSNTFRTKFDTIEAHSPGVVMAGIPANVLSVGRNLSKTPDIISGMADDLLLTNNNSIYTELGYFGGDQPIPINYGIYALNNKEQTTVISNNAIYQFNYDENDQVTGSVRNTSIFLGYTIKQNAGISGWIKSPTHYWQNSTYELIPSGTVTETPTIAHEKYKKAGVYQRIKTNTGSNIAFKLNKNVIMYRGIPMIRDENNEYHFRMENCILSPYKQEFIQYSITQCEFDSNDDFLSGVFNFQTKAEGFSNTISSTSEIISSDDYALLDNQKIVDEKLKQYIDDLLKPYTVELTYYAIEDLLFV